MEKKPANHDENPRSSERSAEELKRTGRAFLEFFEETYSELPKTGKMRGLEDGSDWMQVGATLGPDESTSASIDFIADVPANSDPRALVVLRDDEKGEGVVYSLEGSPEAGHEVVRREFLGVETREDGYKEVVQGEDEEIVGTDEVDELSKYVQNRLADAKKPPADS